MSNSATPLPSLTSPPYSPGWFESSPEWLQMVVITIATALVLWLAVTVLKITLRILLFAVVFVGLATAMWIAIQGRL
jgi:hypothetical protein